MWVRAKELESRMQGTIGKGRLRHGGVRGCRGHRKVEEEKIGQTLRLTKRLSGRRDAELPVSAALPLGTWKAHRSILDKREPAGTFPPEHPLRFDCRGFRSTSLLFPGVEFLFSVDPGGIGGFLSRGSWAHSVRIPTRQW